ncbi:MAG: hypothetical protein LC700_00165 [Actinobacteria bacterium]|nr:hypothetical protein [Actinomycetota bacterium]
MFDTDDTNADDGPLVRGASPASGMFPTSSRSKLSPVRASTVRMVACASLVLALLWIAGVGSLLAVPLGILAVSSPEAGRAFRLVGAAGIAIGLAGLGLALYLAVTSWSPPGV